MNDNADMTCEYCGGSEWVYVGEAYDDEEHLGGLYQCLECGHTQLEGEGEGEQ